MTAPLDLAAVKRRWEDLMEPDHGCVIERVNREPFECGVCARKHRESAADVRPLIKEVERLAAENARLRADNENANLAASVSRKAFACSASEAVRFVAEHFGDCIQWHELGRRRKAAIRRWVLAYADRIAPKASIDAAQGGR